MALFSFIRIRVFGGDMRGLSNCGLSCCINALLQSFAATTELEELLSRWDPSRESDHNNVLLELKKALQAMKNETQTSPHLEFLKCLHNNHICRFTQHDADEVFHTVINLIQKQLHDQQTAAAIKNLYKIEVESCTQCVECDHVHRVPNLFLSFPLPLHENTNDLKDCLKMFFEYQTLERSDAFYCVNCEKKTTSVQGYKLVSLPSILCINLKRFRSRNGRTTKLSTKVCFPETINSAELFPENHCQVPTRMYKLYAVIVHHGTAGTGHYTAYIYSPDGQWYYADDSHVLKVSWERVQETYGGKESSKTAYMLLYRTVS